MYEPLYERESAGTNKRLLYKCSGCQTNGSNRTHELEESERIKEYGYGIEERVLGTD